MKRSLRVPGVPCPAEITSIQVEPNGRVVIRGYLRSPHAQDHQYGRMSEFVRSYNNARFSGVTIITGEGTEIGINEYKD